MGLPYPGGAVVDKLAHEGNKQAIAFPSPAISKDTLDFSFSGLKTAVINYLNTKNQKGEEICREDVCASVTYSITEAICEKTKRALIETGYKKVVLAGGVSANSHIREELSTLCQNMGAEFFAPELRLCGDNAAMIGAQGYYEYLNGARGGEDLNAYPS